MYHQFRVSKSDAEALKFLWQEDLSESDPEVYQMVVHIFSRKLEETTSAATTHQQLRVC